VQRTLGCGPLLLVYRPPPANTLLSPFEVPVKPGLAQNVPFYFPSSPRSELR
jgi:hypothetical protein